MTDSLLTAHYQIGLPPWARRFFERSGIKWAVLMDPGNAPPLPELSDINWIIRFYADESVEKAEVEQGEDGAWKHYKRLEPLLDVRPWLSEERFFVATNNEMTNAGLYATRKGRESVNAHEAAFAKIMWEQKGIRVCGYQIGVGHPEPEHLEQLFTLGMPALKKYGGLWSYHGYGYPNVMDAFKYHAGRAIMVMDGLDKLGVPYPRLAMTEAGIDGLLAGVRAGWKTVNNNPRWYVFDNLAHLDRAMRKDGRTVCIAVFTGTANEKWKTYEVDEPLADVMVEYAVGEGSGNPPAEDDPDDEEDDVSDIWDYVSIIHKAGAKYRLKSAKWLNEAESGGRHHIYVNVLDKNGKRKIGVPVHFSWQDGDNVVPTEEKPGEPFACNFPMYGVLGSYDVWIDKKGDSDEVRNMGLGTPETPTVPIHTSFELIFGESGEEPEPPEPPDPGCDEDKLIEVRALIEQASDLLDQAMSIIEEMLP